MTLAYKKIFSFVLIAALAVVTGYSVGVIYLDMNTAPTGLSDTVADLKASDSEIQSLYNSSKTSSVLDFNAIELWQIAEYKLMQQEKFQKVMTGSVVSAGVPVALKSIKTKNGDSLTYQKMSPSKTVAGIKTPDICSLVKYNYKTPNAIEIIKAGTFVDPEASSENLEATFPARGDVYTASQYFQMFHAQPNESVLPFIISDKTCDETMVSAVSQNEDGTFTFEINLSGEALAKAALYYSYEIYFSTCQQVVVNADGSITLVKGYSMPEWKNAKITATIDSDFMFKTISYKENYNVYNAPVIGRAAVADDFFDTFYYGDAVAQ